MKKLVFLGCENSHATTFLQFIARQQNPELQVLGVYSDDVASAQKLAQDFGVYVMQRYDEFVHQADGVIITARHGDKHLEYALPYIENGVTMMLDKPITIDESQAIQLMSLCKEQGVKISGGSSLRYDSLVMQLASEHAEQADGITTGGVVRCPMSYNSVYGGFFFYAQHLVETVQVIFGRHPQAVTATKNEQTISTIFHYDGFDVLGIFVDECYSCYYVARLTKQSERAGKIVINYDNPCFALEWQEFCDLLFEKSQQKSTYQDFIAPVFVMNAIVNSVESGKRETIAYPKI